MLKGEWGSEYRYQKREFRVYGLGWGSEYRYHNGGVYGDNKVIINTHSPTLHKAPVSLGFEVYLNCAVKHVNHS